MMSLNHEALNVCNTTHSNSEERKSGPIFTFCILQHGLPIAAEGAGECEVFYSWMKDRWEEGRGVCRLSIISLNLSSVIAQVYSQRACSINQAAANSSFSLLSIHSCICSAELFTFWSSIDRDRIPSYDTSEIRTSGGPTYERVLFKKGQISAR
jgi:hypothetical protein